MFEKLISVSLLILILIGEVLTCYSTQYEAPKHDAPKHHSPKTTSSPAPVTVKTPKQQWKIPEKTQKEHKAWLAENNATQQAEDDYYYFGGGNGGRPGGGGPGGGGPGGGGQGGGEPGGGGPGGGGKGSGGKRHPFGEKFPESWEGYGLGNSGQNPPPWAIVPNAFGRPDYCFADPEFGYCDVNVSRWGYNSYMDDCFEFFYSGCGGNLNRFLSKKRCESSCKSKLETECNKQGVYSDYHY